MANVVLVQATLRAAVWYTSGTFWSVAGVGIGALAIVMGAVTTYRSDNPRRRLYIFASSTTHLRHVSGGQLTGLEIRNDGRVLNDPHLVTVEIISRGRCGIPPESFDGPIELDFGAEIVTVLESISAATPEAVPAPVVTRTATALQVGPALLAREHKISYRILVDGDAHFVGKHSLVNVDVRLGSPTQRTNKLAELTLAAGLAFAVAGFIVSLALPLDGLVPRVLAVEIVGILAILAGFRLAPQVPGDGE